MGQFFPSHYGSAVFRAKPEFLWPGEIRARSPLASPHGQRPVRGDPGPDGRVNFGAVLPGYTYSGFAVGPGEIMGLFGLLAEEDIRDRESV